MTQRLATHEKTVVLGLGSSNGVRIPPNVETELRRSQAGLEEGAFVVGFVGRLTADKGIDILLHSANLLERRGVNIQLLLLGAEEPPGYLAERATNFGVSPRRVMWRGFVPDATPYFRLMDVLCLPTRREGFPNVVLEAAVRGVPSVVADVTGARDSVVAEQTGLLFPVDDVESLAEILSRLSNSPESVRLMGRNAVEHAVRHYDREKIWSLNHQYLESLLPRQMKGL